MSHLKSYFELLVKRKNPSLVQAVNNTVKDVVPKYISNFSYREHVTSLLLGNIQSGKTSHMFGIISATADEGFGIFIILTTDNIRLQQQTLSRAENDLQTFCICGEEDFLKFTTNNLRKPTIIVLKKNWRILRRWKNNFSSTNFCAGNPLFIVDDEADAISLNTLVNKRKQSKINSLLQEIKQTSSSSIFLQVTGTPQAILLQSINGMKPYFIHYFEPGDGYIGGEFFFGDSEDNPYVILTDNDEVEELLADDEFHENNLKASLLIFLISSAHIFEKKIDSVANFMIHPSIRTSDHGKFAEKIGDYLNDLIVEFEEGTAETALRAAYDNLRQTEVELISFSCAHNFLKKTLENDNISILVINSIARFDENSEYNKGINIIVGGNSLSRGVTFPKLQTVYYCRQSNRPQADTMWQHSRMFGYDREKELMRIFMSPVLYKLFKDINKTNNSIISQIIRFENIADIKLNYPAGLAPTRKNVIDNSRLRIITGGVNYFPFIASNTSIELLDRIMEPFSNEDFYRVSLKLLKVIIGECGSKSSDWDKCGFLSAINVYVAKKPSAQGILIVRRDRDIAKGTGTLLSPNDRALGQLYKDDIVLTMYNVTGRKGWDGNKVWVPNVKFPEGQIYYDMN